MDPAIQVFGAYRVEVDESLLDQAFEAKYGDLDLSSQEEVERRAEVVDELSGLALIEIVVRNRNQDFDVSDFHQVGSEQAAYGEVFLSDDGTRVLSHGDEIPEGEPLRIAFFLHFFDPAIALETSYGPVDLPALQPVPPRLVELMPYEPVD